MRYAVARFDQQMDELGYRYYVSDLMRLYGHGKTLGVSYHELRNGTEAKEEHTAEEIIAEVVQSAGITLED